jgi:hypothetical protein
VRSADNLTTFLCLNLLVPYVPVQVCYEIALPPPLPYDGEWAAYPIDWFGEQEKLLALQRNERFLFRLGVILYMLRYLLFSI